MGVAPLPRALPTGPLRPWGWRFSKAHTPRAAKRSDRPFLGQCATLGGAAFPAVASDSIRGLIPIEWPVTHERIDLPVFFLLLLPPWGFQRPTCRKRLRRCCRCL